MLVPLQIPHPSLSEVLVSAEIFCILYPLRMLMKVLETEEQKLRREIIQHHAKHHKTALKACHTENCSLLSAAVSSDVTTKD
jgi:hypothetical protein